MHKSRDCDFRWQKCGAGVNGSFHTANGDPIVDTKKFPSLSAMVDKAHSLGLHAGFYMNNCGCNEHEFKDPDMIAKVLHVHINRYSGERERDDH